MSTLSLMGNRAAGLFLASAFCGLCSNRPYRPFTAPAGAAGPGQSWFHKKRQALSGLPFFRLIDMDRCQAAIRSINLQCYDVFRLGAFLTLGDGELDVLTFGQ